MNLTEATRAILFELKRQRTEGVRQVFLEDQTLSGLCELLGENEASVSEDFESVSNRKPIDYPSPLSKEQNTEKLQMSSLSEPKKQVIAFEAEESKDFPPPPEFTVPEGDKVNRWNWLKRKILSCEVCNQELNENGKIVFGEGNLDADIFFCGEAPGAEEEMQGKPFVGPAGELLSRIIEAMGISREQVYIGNILNWRPRHNLAYGNRPPTREEMSFCLPYLKAQIEIVRPRVLVALGKTATDGLLGHDPQRRLSDLRGRWSESMQIPMMVTYHPSYLLHNPSKASKRKVWQDMLLVMEKLEMDITEKQRAFFSD